MASGLPDRRASVGPGKHLALPAHHVAQRFAAAVFLAQPGAVVRAAPPARSIEILGPAEAPLAVVRSRHRWRVLVKAPRETDLQAYLRLWLAAAPAPKGDLRLTVDVDPYNFL